MSGGERGKVFSLIGTVTSGVGLEGCREGKARGRSSRVYSGSGGCGGARHPGVHSQRGGFALRGMVACVSKAAMTLTGFAGSSVLGEVRPVPTLWMQQ